MKDLSPDIKKDRVHRLLSLSKKLREEYKKGFYGKELEVLFEEYDPVTKTIQGHTGNYLLVRVMGEESMRGTFGNVVFNSQVSSD